MKEELASLGPHRLHLSVGYGRPLRFPDRTATRAPGLRRGRELPVPQVQLQDGDLTWDEDLFAHLPIEAWLQPREDDTLVVHLRVRACGTGASSRALHFGDTSEVQFGYKARVNARRTGKSVAHRFDHPYGLVDGKVRYVLN